MSDIKVKFSIGDVCKEELARAVTSLKISTREDFKREEKRPRYKQENGSSNEKTKQLENYKKATRGRRVTRSVHLVSV